MEAITCQVIDSRENSPIFGMRVSLKSLSRHNGAQTTSFKGCTRFDGWVQNWCPDDGISLNDFIQNKENDNGPQEMGKSDSLWQISLDTLGLYGPHGSCWPALDIMFYLCRKEQMTYHISIIIGPFDFKTAVTMQPLAELPQDDSLQPIHGFLEGLDAQYRNKMVPASEIKTSGNHERLDAQYRNNMVPASEIVTSDNHERLESCDQSSIVPRIETTIDTAGHAVGSNQEDLGAQVQNAIELGTASRNRAQSEQPRREHITQTQRMVLMESFHLQPYPDGFAYDELSSQLGVSRLKLQAWFVRERKKARTGATGSAHRHFGAAESLVSVNPISSLGSISPISPLNRIADLPSELDVDGLSGNAMKIDKNREAVNWSSDDLEAAVVQYGEGSVVAARISDNAADQGANLQQSLSVKGQFGSRVYRKRDYKGRFVSK